MKKLDDFHDKPEKNQERKTKQLFIQGEQDTRESVVAMCANLMVFATFAIIKTSTSHLYGCIKQYIDILVSEEGRNLFNRQLVRHPHLPHCIVNDVHHIMTSHFTVMVRKPTPLKQLQNNLLIQGRSSLKIAGYGFENRLKTFWSATNGTLGEYRYPPDSYSIFASKVEKRTIGGRTQGSDTTKRQKTGDKKNGTGKGGPTALTPDKIEKLKSKGWLRCTKPCTRPPLINHKLKKFDNRKPCSFFVFEGFYCKHGPDCKFPEPNQHQVAHHQDQDAQRL